MAPRKTKTDAPASTVDDTTLVLNYLREQNRPYSANDISANLHNQVTKAQATKILQKLHAKGDIVERTAGKGTVYHTPQSTDPNPITPTTLNATLESLKAQLATIKSEEKSLRAALAALVSKPTLAQLRLDIRVLEAERDEIQSRLARSRASATAAAGVDAGAEKKQKPVILSAEDRAKLEYRWKVWSRQALLRKRICRDLWDRCSEVLPGGGGCKEAEELWESLGLEGVL